MADAAAASVRPGTDIVSVPRIAALLERAGDRFARRWFTAGEIAYCDAAAVPSRHYAARLAAKEAVVKALPVRWEGPLPWRWIEITRSAAGEPGVSLHGDVRAAADRAGVRAVSVSLSHCDEFATAVALVHVAVAAASGPAEETP